MKPSVFSWNVYPIGSSSSENSEMPRLPSEAVVQVFLGSWNFSTPFSPWHFFAEGNANVTLQKFCRIKCFGKSNITAIWIETHKGMPRELYNLGVGYLDGNGYHDMWCPTPTKLFKQKPGTSFNLEGVKKAILISSNAASNLLSTISFSLSIPMSLEPGTITRFMGKVQVRPAYEHMGTWSMASNYAGAIT